MFYFQLIMGGMAALLVGSVAWPKFKAWQASKAAGTQMTLFSAPPVLQGEIVDTSFDQLRNALKLLTCHVACEVDDTDEQTAALDACRTLKRIALKPLPSARTDEVVANQAAIVAAVNAYHNAADKITAVG